MRPDHLDGLDLDQRAQHRPRALGRPREHAPLLVTAAGDEVVGFAGFGPVRDRYPQASTARELYGIDARPDRWRVGIGGALLAAVRTRPAIAGNHRIKPQPSGAVAGWLPATHGFATTRSRRHESARAWWWRAAPGAVSRDVPGRLVDVDALRPSGS
jgi:GNAT superfamily N-acetyltransferase